MTDPQLIVYERLLYEDEILDLGDLNLQDHAMDIGFYFTNQRGEFIDIPKSIGKVKATQVSKKDASEMRDIGLKPCTEAFQKVNQNLPKSV